MVAMAIVVGVLLQWHLEVPAPASAPASVAKASLPRAVAAPGNAGETAALPPGASPAAVTEAAEGAPRRTGEGRIELAFERESWVEVKDRNGRILLSQLNFPGSRRVIDGHPPFSVTIGNAAGVRLRYNDEVIDLKPHIKVEVARLALD